MARLRGVAAGAAALGLASLVIGCAPPPGRDAAQLVTRAPTQAPLAQPEEEQPQGHREAEAPAPARADPAPGVQQVGVASYYGPQFNGRLMANGRRFDPRSTTVAHRTLPFGTTVRVTNLENGRSATATVQDRGPFIRGRIVDLSPRLAENLGMVRQGLAPVELTLVELAEAPD